MGGKGWISTGAGDGQSKSKSLLAGAIVGRRDTRPTHRRIVAGSIVAGEVVPQLTLAELEAYLAATLYSRGLAGSRTEAAGKVTSLVDAVNPGVGARAVDANHAFVQAAPAQQPLPPTADAALNGQLSLTFTGAQYFNSSIPGPVNWAPQSNGAGGLRYYVFVPTDVANTSILSGTIGATSVNGYQSVLSAGGSFAEVVYGISGPGIASGTTAAGALVNGVGTFTIWTYSEAASPKYVLRLRSAIIASGPSSGVGPSPNVTGGSARIGARNDGAVPFKGRLAEAGFANTVDPSLVANLIRYMSLKYGLV